MDNFSWKFGAILIISLFCLTGVSATWNFEESAGTPSNISENSTSVFSAKLLTSNDNELNPNRLEFNVEEPNATNYVNYTAEDNGDTTTGTLNYSEGLDAWYAEFDEAPDELNFTAQGRSSPEFENSEGVAKHSFNYDLGTLNLTLVSEMETVRPGTEERVDVSVGDSSGNFLPESDIEIYFNNHSASTSTQDIAETDTGEEIHYDDVNIPDNSDSTYIYRIQAVNGSNSGSVSGFIDISPRLGFTVNEFRGLNCEGDSIASKCESEAEINAEVEITRDQADNVTVETWVRERETDNLENLTNNSLSNQDGSVYSGNLEMPEINTSKYYNYGVFRINATNEFYSVTEDIQIDLEPYSLSFEGNNNGFQGSEYELSFRAEKPYSEEAYNLTRFNDIEGNVSRDGSFDLAFEYEDFEYDESEGLITSTMNIPDDASTGIHDVEFNFTDLYNESRTISDTFRVNEFDQNFEITDGLEPEVGKLHEVNRSLTVVNNGGATLEIENNLSEELDEVVEINESFSLEPEEERELNFTVNLTEPENANGIINMTESNGYIESREMEIITPDCESLNGSICVDHSEVDFGETDTNETGEIEIFNLMNGELELNTSVSGNISEYIDTNSNISISDSEDLTVIFEPETSGLFTGNLVLESESDSVNINLTANSSATEQEVSWSISASSRSLELPEGESEDIDVTVENTGDATISSITASMENHDIDIDEFSLEPEESNTFTVTVQESDELNVTGSADSEELLEQISIEVSEIDDYSERASEIEDEASRLRESNDDPSLQGDITDLELAAENIRTRWNNGNYEGARQLFEDTQEDINEIESEIQAQQNEPSNPEDPQNPDDPQGGNQDGQNQDEGGGLPIIPIVAILLVLSLVGGFIFYESYIPEEGDPLYGVMGE